MKSFYQRCVGGSSVFSLGVGAAALVALLGAGCSSPASDGSPDGGVRDQAGGSSDLPVAGFSVTSVFPYSGLLAGGNTVNVVGTGFAPGATVMFGNSPATGVQLLSLTQLSAVVPASTSGVGPVTVTVKNPDGSSAAHADAYSYYRVQVALSPAITAAVGTNPVALVAADINGDGYNEIVTANQTSNNVTVLAYNQSWNNGVAYPAATSPTSLVAADFNNNGRPDVAVGCSSATGDDIAVLSDNGGIGFQTPLILHAAINMVGIDAHDLNGDGKIDLVAAARSTGLAYTFLNTTTSLNPTFTVGSTFAVGSQPSAVVLNDLDGDGKVDLVATSFGDGTVNVLLGLGNGNFGTAKVAPTSSQPIALGLGDVNKDGRTDVVTASFNTKQVSLLLSQGDGTLPTLHNLPAGTQPMSVAVADIDRDGNQDLIFANSGDNSVTVLLGRGDGTFDPAQSFAVGSQPVALLVADLNKDGKLDIATANYNSSNVSILYNQIQ